MELNSIITLINAKLAGELLTYNDLKVHMDSVIDDINDKLSSRFPAFSEFNVTDFPQYPNYNLFPDKFIRSVVVAGAAFKWFITDEEGAESATTYEYDYLNALFIMQRDYSNSIPSEYQADYQGYLLDPTTCSSCGCATSSCACSPCEPSDYFPSIRYVDRFATGDKWNGVHLTQGNYHFWIDSNGDYRYKDGDPIDEFDGIVIGGLDTDLYNEALVQFTSDINALDTRISTVEGYDLDTRISTVEGYDLDTRVTAVEGYGLDDLSDVTLTTPAEGDLLKYDATAGLWKNFEPAVVFTAEGGLAIKLINNTGVASVKGSLVSTSTAIDNAFILQDDEFDSIGVVYEDGITDGSSCLVVVSGIAEVLLKDTTAATRGYWAIAADTDGRADITQPTPFPNNTLGEHTQHFKEIGHCIESKTAGTNVLAKVILHFN